jgi:hypothetical protein
MACSEKCGLSDGLTLTRCPTRYFVDSFI